MNHDPQSSWLIRIITGVCLLLSSTVAGAVLGLVWVKLFATAESMGWDALADALGGMMLGGLVGLVIGGLMIARLSVRRQWAGFAIGLALVGLAIVGLPLSAPNREEAPPPAAKTSFQPFFRIGLRLSHTQEILSAVAAAERPLPFTEAEVSSGKPELVYVVWGPDFHRCTGVPSEIDLESIVPRIQKVIASADLACKTPENDLSLSVYWNMAGEIGNQSLDVGCLPDQPAVRELADAIAALGRRLCGTNAVAPS